MAIQAGIKVVVDQGSIQQATQQIDDVSKKMQDVLDNIKANINVEDSMKQLQGLQTEIDTLKESLANMSNNDKSIVNINSEQFIAEAKKITGTIDEVKIALANLQEGSTVKTTSSWIDDETGKTTKFIAEIKTAQGELQKLEFNAGEDQSGNPTDDFNFSAVKSVVDNTMATQQVQISKEESASLAESNDLLKQQYSLQTQINTAEEKGRDDTLAELTAQKEDVDAKLEASKANLNSDSLAQVAAQEITNQNKLNLQLTQQSDKQTEINAKVEQEVASFKTLSGIKLQNLESTAGDALKNSDIQEQIASLKEMNSTINSENFSEKQGEFNTQLKQTQANVRSVNTELGNTNNTFGELLANTGKFATWMASATILMGVINGIKDMVSNVETLDTQLTQLSYVSNMSTQQLKDFATSEIGVATSMGATVDTVREASRIFTNLNSTTAQVLENTKAATAFSGVTGQDIETSASALQSVTNQFTEMQGKTMQAGDAITKVAANLSMDFQTASTNIASAVKISGSAMSESGMDFNTYIGYISAAEEKTQLSGETLGTAFKTMAARINQVKTDDLTPTTDEMANAEKALGSIGISIRAANGTLNPLSDTLQALGEKWNTLNNVQKANIGYYVAGTRQISVLDATMGSYTRATELSNVAQNSAGNLMELNAKKADSFAGRVNTLTATWQGLSTQLISTSWLKSGVSGLNDIVNEVSVLTTKMPLAGVAVAGLTAAFVAFIATKNTLKMSDIGNSIASLVTDIVAATEASSAGAVAADVLAVAWDTVATAAKAAMVAMLESPLTWIALAVAGIVALTNSYATQKKEVDDLDASVKQYKSDLANNSVTTTDESNLASYQKKLDDLKAQKDKDMNSTTGASNAGEVLTAKDDQAINDYKKTLTSANLTIDATTGKIKDLKSAQDAISNDKSMSASQRELEADNTSLTSSTGKVIDSYMTLSAQGNKGTIEKAQQAADVKTLTDTYTNLKTKIDANGNTVISNTDVLAKDTEALITNKGALTSNGSAATTATIDIKSLTDAETDLGTTLSSAKSNIESINTVLATHASTGKWDYDTILTLTKTYPNLLAAMGNDKDLTNILTQDKKAESDAATGSIDSQIKGIEDQVNSSLSAYGIDLKNYTSAQQAKTAIADVESKKRQAIIDAEFADADKKDSNGEQAAADKEGQLAEKAQNNLNANGSTVDASDSDLIDKYFTEKSEKAGADKLLTDVANQADTTAATKDATTAKTAATAATKLQTDALKSETQALEAEKTAYDNNNDAAVKTLSDQKSAYDLKVDNASKAEIIAEDAIIKGYDNQLTALKAKNQLQTDNNTLVKDQTDLIKAQNDMQNAQSEKDVRVYENGQWQWEADSAAVNTAKDTLSTANTTLTTEIASLAETAAENAITAKSTTETDKKAAYATNYQTTKDAYDQSNDAKQKTLTDAKSATDLNYSAQETTVTNKQDALQGYADGTDSVPQTGSYLVGENGKEIVTLPQGASVTPNNVTEQVLSSSANTATAAASTSATNVIITDTKKALLDIDDTITTFVNASGEYSKDTEQIMGTSVTTNKTLIEKPITDLKTEIDTQIKQYVDGTGAYSVTANKNIGDAITTTAPTVIDPTKLLITNVKSLIVAFAQSTIDDGTEVTSQLGKGITDGEANLTKIIDDLCTKIEAQFRKDMGIHSPSTVMHEIGGFITQGLINGMDEADIEKFISDKVGTMSSAFSGESANVSGSLKDWVAQALKDTGLDPSNAPMLETIAMKESSGDPTNINTYDINAQEGHPSKGLMQMIDETFNAHKLAGHDNIMNPVDNLDSAIKYMLSRYGSISNVPGIKSMAAGGAYQGYATGTDYVPSTGAYNINEQTREGAETVLLPQGTGVLNASNTTMLRLLAENGSNLLSNLRQPNFSQPNINVNIPKAEKQIQQQGANITVQNVNMPDGIDAEGFINTLNQIAKTS